MVNTFFSQPPSWLQTSQSSANFTVLRGTEISAPGCSCSLSEWCDLSGGYWPTTIRLFIGQSQLKRVMLVYRVLTWNLWFCHSLPSNTAYQGPLPTCRRLPWDCRNGINKMLKHESVMSKNYEKDCESLTSKRPETYSTKLPWRAVSSLHLVVPWLGTPSWIGLSLSHPTRPCDAQKGHGWEHR